MFLNKNWSKHNIYWIRSWRHQMGPPGLEKHQAFVKDRYFRDFILKINLCAS